MFKAILKHFQQQLKDLKLDCDREEEKCEYWNDKSAEIEKVVEMLKEQRKSLGERVEEEKRMEQEQKLEELEMLLKKTGKKRQILDENANLVASFSSLTEESS